MAMTRQDAPEIITEGELFAAMQGAHYLNFDYRRGTATFGPAWNHYESYRRGPDGRWWWVATARDSGGGIALMGCDCDPWDEEANNE